MDRSRFQRDWEMIKDRVKERWAKLTDDDVNHIKGRRNELVSRVKKAYNCSDEEAKSEVDLFEHSLAQQHAHAGHTGPMSEND